MNAKFLNASFDFAKSTLYKLFHKDIAKMLIGMGALGFALSSMAQCFAIKINDKIDDKKKGFLLRQEAADGAVNIGLFLAVTSSVWKVSDKILKTFGLLNCAEKDLKQIKSGGRIVTTMIASVLACNVITPLVRNLIAGKITACKDKKEQKAQINTLIYIKNQIPSPFNNFDNWAVRAINNRQALLKSGVYKYGNNSGSLKI